MMKKLAFVLTTVAAVSLFAQEVVSESDSVQPREERRRESAAWPAFFAVCEYPASPDVIGLRVTLPYSTRQENVTGIDLGLWGRATYFEGLQLSIVRNDAKDTLAGFQIGLYNSAGRADALAIQIGLWNEANSFRGLQAGLVNTCGDGDGFQVGLVNRAESLYGFQVGVINVIRDNEFAFLPVLNIGF